MATASPYAPSSYTPVAPVENDWLRSRDVNRMFTCGDCFQLAKAIHELTDWKLCSMIDEEDNPSVHSFVITPAGYALDIEGLHDVDALLDEWLVACGYKEINLSEFYEIWPDELTPGKNTVALAKDAAQLLVEFAATTRIEVTC